MGLWQIIYYDIFYSILMFIWVYKATYAYLALICALLIGLFSKYIKRPITFRWILIGSLIIMFLSFIIFAALLYLQQIYINPDCTIVCGITTYAFLAFIPGLFYGISAFIGFYIGSFIRNKLTK